MKEAPMRQPVARLLSLLAFVAAAAAADRAQAQQPPPPEAAPAPPAVAPGGGFGAPGTWVFTFETADGGSGYASFHKVSGGGSTVTLNPGADYFLAPDISLGATLTFSHTSGGGSIVGGGLRAGYAVPLVGDFGFWPSLRVFVVHGTSPSSTTTSMGVFAPFLWHATTHFFLGGGPDLNTNLSGGNYTEYGLDFILGGWL
jgi:hypothetical protein